MNQHSTKIKYITAYVILNTLTKKHIHTMENISNTQHWLP